MTQKPLFARLSRRAKLKDRLAPLVRWMLENYDDFAAAIGPVRHPGWAGIADELDGEGLKGPDGKTLTADYCRQCWFRAKRYAARSAPKPAAVAAPALLPEKTRPQVDDDIPMFKTGGLKRSTQREDP